MGRKEHEAEEMNINVIGNPGSGKTLLATEQIIEALEEGKVVISNFSVFYHADVYNAISGLKPNRIERMYLDELALRLMYHNIAYPLGSVDVWMDEAYMIFESRKSIDPVVTLLSRFPLQARKSGMNLGTVVQLGSSVDKRLRFIADRNILCKREYSGTGETIFYYIVFDGEGRFLYDFHIDRESAQKLFPLYNTSEIVEEPVYDREEHEALIEDIMRMYDAEDKRRAEEGKDGGVWNLYQKSEKKKNKPVESKALIK